MRCIYCFHDESKVVDTRTVDDGQAVRRRRECVKCGKRFTSFEKVDTRVVMVIKKDGRRQPFNTDKIRIGLIKACEKRPAAQAKIEQVVAEIERDVMNLLEPEVSSDIIGEMVMKALKNLDEVAYVRFASVYRQFTDINTFMKELATLLHEDRKDQ